MAILTGKIFDANTEEIIECRVQVISSRGHFVSPKNTILKIGPGMPFFYCDGHFKVDIPRGETQVLVERGTEYQPAKLNIYTPASGSIAIDIGLERWTSLSEMGWHPGNTHIHYDDRETSPDERLKLDPRVEDLRVTIISILQRKGQAPASNKYPIGVLTEFCSAHHHVECGEESRHNSANDIPEQGYGHIMLLRISEIVEPVSRGYLADPLGPDYPPLVYACDEAHRQGGVVIWCHNGIGLEAPVAAALGKVDAINLFDPFWFDPEYEIWYSLLNCGFKLPVSTGSDWYICNANRVYTYTGAPFNYEDWIIALKRGHTFVTNGPAIFLTVEDQIPGALIETEPGRELLTTVTWISHYTIQRIELVFNGKIIASKEYQSGSIKGQFSTRVKVPSDGWIAARLGSSCRDSYYQPIWAHTSPIYIETGVISKERKLSASHFFNSINSSLEWVIGKQRYLNKNQGSEVIELFKKGQAIYRQLMK